MADNLWQCTLRTMTFGSHYHEQSEPKNGRHSAEREQTSPQLLQRACGDGVVV